jgi:ABC-type nitrate/sulfonate/bicarbonate transport system ATPase subunit
MKPTEAHPSGNDNNPGLIIRQLCAWFEQNEEHRKPVFWGVSLDVPPAYILGVAGPNGSGKTTFTRSIAGLHEWRTGEVEINGKLATSQMIGFVPQAYSESFFPWTSLLTNITLLSKATRERVRELANDIGLKLNLDLRPPQCSGGTIQQAAILRAMTSNPALLLADEPFSALDVRVAARVRQAFRVYVKKYRIPAIVISHDFLSLVELCDGVLAVPGIPFSTANIEGYEVARVIQNKHLAVADSSRRSTDDSETFVEKIDRLLRV